MRKTLTYRCTGSGRNQGGAGLIPSRKLSIKLSQNLTSQVVLYHQKRLKPTNVPQPMVPDNNWG